MDAEIADFVGPFPTAGLVPKTETGVLNFLQKYPQYNGRDVTIAIFDSGVDARAVGLETLTDGKTAKVIERYDCSGCGDVDTSKKVTADADGYITALSGRRLKLTAEMVANNTANGEFRVGMKPFGDICTSKVRENIMNQLKLKYWDKPQKTAIAEVSRKLIEFESKNADSSQLPWDKKLEKYNLDYLLEMLNNYEKSFLDSTITYDCILYPTANGWQCVVDLSEAGDLEKALHIGEFSKTHEMKNVNDFLSISMNVHDEGNVLEIVGMCSPHGTHVAAIASGCHNNQDDDGVAPDAKIVSLTIGDGRLGSMETGTALVRAMKIVMDLCRSGRKVDVINMSYGEHSHWSNAGRIGELMNEVVDKYGVVWVASAGNHGPALSTVGSPPDISQPSCIGVGAYVSSSMMEAEYSLREKLPGNVYTWTSRDPCIDGGSGVTVCAPGGAITSVPQFTMSKTRHMNGTSMAAPHVAGAVALLISGLKQRGIAYSPYSIKRAICATAKRLSYVDPFAQGSGLLNVEAAFEHLVQNSKAAENMLRFAVMCGPQNAKGIHLREGVLKKPHEVSVCIEPVFLNDKEVAPEDKYGFNVRLTLLPSEPWVQCGSYLDMSYASRSISVRIDPSGMAAGVHSAKISAYDSDNVQKGPLFDIPITVVQPHVIDCSESRVFEPASVEFQPNTIQRNFILVPNGATWALLRMRSIDSNRNKDVGKFFVHTMQLLPKSSCRVLEVMKLLSVGSENESLLIIKCQDNNILELCIAKYWSNFGSTHLKFSLEFHGVRPVNPNAYTMHAADGIHRIDLAALVLEDIQPQLQLKTAVVVLKPVESKISPLSATRDVIPDGRQVYQNVLTYSFQVPKAQEVTLYAPVFNSLLYESEFESQLFMVFDSNKMMMFCGDAHSNRYTKKLEKGEYTVRLQVRHEKRESLEKVAETNMLAIFKLVNSITMDLYDHFNQAVIGGRKFNSGLVKDNPWRTLFVAPLSAERLSKAQLPANCAWLAGSFALAKEETIRKIDTEKFKYILAPAESGGSKKNGGGGNGSPNGSSSSKSKNASPTVSTNTSITTVPSTAGDGVGGTPPPAAAAAAPPASPSKKVSGDDYAESLRDFHCSMIGKCELAKAEKIYEEVIAAHPKHLQAHLVLISAIEQSELKAQMPFAFEQFCSSKGCDEPKGEKKDAQALRAPLERIIELADKVIQEIDKDSLLAFYGIKMDTRPDATKIKQTMDKQKANLLEALVKKGTAIGRLSVLNNNKGERIEDLNNIFFEVMKFIDPNDPKVIQFSLWHAYANSQYGRLYKFLQKVFEDKRSREALDEVKAVMTALEYGHLEKHIDRMTVSAFPSGYRLF